MKNKHKSKITLCALLILVLVTNIMLTSCGSETEAESGGSYFEKDVPLPEGVTNAADFYIGNDKEIVMAGFNEDYSEGTVWTTSDKGKNWEKLSTFTEGIELKIPKEAYDTHIAAFSPKGDIFYSVSWDSDDIKAEAYNYIINDGGAREFKIDLPQDPDYNEGFYNNVFDAEYADNGMLIVKDKKGDLYGIDGEKGDILVNYNEGSSQIDYNTYTVSGDNLYLFTTKKAYAASLKTGKTVELDNTIDSFTKNVKMVTDEEKMGRQKVYINENESDIDSVFSINYKGIKKYDGKSAETLSDGSGTLLSLSHTLISTVELLDDDNLMMIVSSDEGKILVNFENMPELEKGAEEISIYMLKEKTLNSTSILNKAIVMFQKKYPAVKIKLEIGVSGDDSITETDALKTLNSEILSGNGPDIIVFDDIAISNFIDNDMLLDISDSIEKVNKSDELIENVVNQYNKDGKSYAVPTLFSPMVISSGSDVIDSADTLADLAIQVEKLSKNKDVPVATETYKMPMMLYNAYLSSSLQNEDKIDEKIIGDFYSNLKKITDVCISKDEMEDYFKWDQNIVPSMGIFSSSVLTDEAQMSMDYLNSLDNVKDLMATEIAGKGTYDYIGQKNLKLYAPQLILGINAKSEKAGLSKNFIEFVLSEDGQDSLVSLAQPGMSVNKTNLKKDLNLLKKNEFGNESSYYTGSDLKEVKVAIPEMTDKNEKEIMDFVSSVKTPINTDYILMDIIMGYSQDYLLDKSSLEDTVNKAMKKLQIYLEE